MSHLYATPTADRFFRVPTPHELPTGDFLAVGIDGELRVEESALAPFEITKEQAEAHVRGEMERALAGVADTVARALGAAGREPPDLERLAERLGVRGGDKAAAGAALRGLADDMNAITAAVASGDPAELDAARGRLKARGLDVGDALEEIRRLDQDRAKAAAAGGLRALAAAIEDTSEQPLGRRIDELIERLEREVGPWLGRDPEKIRERRQEGYRTSARSSIADSLREAGITPLNDPADDPRA
jgi:HPt (histidine-containing phosphotransfer) domain-containing protein